MVNFNSILSYKTVKIVDIHDWKLGVLHYAIILGIFCYVVVWVIILEKGYQAQGPLIGNANLKVKGNAMVGDSVWDVYDVVYPPKEENAVFLTTNYLDTLNQTKGVCTGVNSENKCATNTDCPANVSKGDGFNTGVCNTTSHHCMLNTWCPVENDITPSNILVGVEAFTILAKITAYFPTWHIFCDNLEGTTSTPNLNLFNVSYLLQESNTKYSDISASGGIILVTANFDCNFDNNDVCLPTFSFTRIDQTKSWTVGYNFRYPIYYWINDPANPYERIETRDLYKVFGIRILFLISGKGAKFSIIPLILNFASGLALLSVATVITDIVALQIFPKSKRNVIYNAKIQMVNDNSEEEKLLQD